MGAIPTTHPQELTRNVCYWRVPYCRFARCISAFVAEWLSCLDEVDHEMEEAYPGELRELMPAVRACLEPSQYRPVDLVQRDPRLWGQIRVGGEVLRIPYRQYDRPPGAAVWSAVRLKLPSGPLEPCGLGGEARLVWMAWFTRSDDGLIRQAAVQELFGQPREWVVPYLVQLLGEYVIEICSDIADFVEGTVTTDAGWAQAFRGFWADNPGFVTLTRARASSYWNEYYRGRLDFADYPSARAMRVLDGLA